MAESEPLVPQPIASPDAGAVGAGASLVTVRAELFAALSACAERGVPASLAWVIDGQPHVLGWGPLKGPACKHVRGDPAA